MSGGASALRRRRFVSWGCTLQFASCRCTGTLTLGAVRKQGGRCIGVRIGWPFILAGVWRGAAPLHWHRVRWRGGVHSYGVRKRWGLASADVGRVSGVGASNGQMFTAAGPIAVHAMQRGGVGEVHKILYSQFFRRGGAVHGRCVRSRQAREPGACRRCSRLMNKRRCDAEASAARCIRQARGSEWGRGGGGVPRGRAKAVETLKKLRAL